MLVRTTNMGTLSRLRPTFLRKTTAEDEAVTPAPQSTGADVLPTPTQEKKTTEPTAGTAAGPDEINTTITGEPDVEQPEKDILPAEDAQRGVQQVEAVTLTWTKPSLVGIFIW